MSTLPLYYQQIKESIIPVIRASGLEVAAAQFKTSVSSLMKFGEPLGFLEAQEIWKRQKVFNHAYRVRANRNFLGDTADFWYFMGLLQGDGHLNERCHRIELELTDREPLDLLQQEIQSDSKVYTRNRGHLDYFDI